MLFYFVKNKINRHFPTDNNFKAFKVSKYAPRDGDTFPDLHYT